MSKRRKKKDFRPKRDERDRTPEPMTVAADARAQEILPPPPAPEAAAEEAISEEAIAEAPRRRSDSLEPVAFLATREAAREEIELAYDEAMAQETAPRPPSRFVPVVKSVVAACAVIALAGGTRAALKRMQAPHSHSTGIAAASPPRPDVTPEEEESAPAEAAPAPEPDVDLHDPALAITLAERARLKLEHRDVLDAIELGEQAVSHDATNARAWVVLGAAYQQNGDLTSARNCYRMCVRGAQIPGDKSREDCAAMLQK